MPVRFADVDHAGIVYYPVFFNYFHIAFEELFRARMGARAYVDLLDRERIGFPSVSAQCDYRSPLRFGDTMDIEVALERLGARSVTLGYHVYKQGEPGTGQPERTLAAHGKNTCVVIDLDAFRAVPMPEGLRELFASLS